MKKETPRTRGLVYGRKERGRDGWREERDGTSEDNGEHEVLYAPSAGASQNSIRPREIFFNNDVPVSAVGACSCLSAGDLALGAGMFLQGITPLALALTLTAWWRTIHGSPEYQGIAKSFESFVCSAVASLFRFKQLGNCFV